MGDKCCPACIGDSWLEKNIFPMLQSTQGLCGFCRAESDSLVRPIELRDYFDLLISAYCEDLAGTEDLIDLLSKDWLLFDCEGLDKNAKKLLLAEILDDGDVIRKKFRPIHSPSIFPVGRWDVLKNELRFKNRYFLDEPLETGRLGQLLDHLIADSVPETWFRARMMSEDKMFELVAMGAPPKNLASHGRANPPGIPYLYLASNPQTGISEIRPHTGEKACVATFNLSAEARIVDLRNPRKTVSPFLLQEEEAIMQLRADLPFLESLGRELTRPVLPRSAAIDYVPSQYLCEFIKKRGFSGVLYSSSVSDGFNLALFDVERAKAVRVEEYCISKVCVDVIAV